MHEKDTANEAQLEPSQTYMMEFFWDNSESFELLTIFSNKFHHRCLEWF